MPARHACPRDIARLSRHLRLRPTFIHARARTDTHIQARTHASRHARPHAHPHAHAYTQRPHAHALKRADVLVHMQAVALTKARVYMPTDTQA
eukprot:3300303-Pleurochrysis_carterae.AAC.1